MSDLATVLTILSALGAAVMGGTFFAFSNFIMGALGALPPRDGAAAMRSINIVVLNAGFFLVFFGTGAIAALSAALDWISFGLVGWRALGAALYVIGCIGVTIVGNVPLNEALARETPESAAEDQLWTRYLRVWTVWNHLRAVACVLASAAFVVAHGGA